MWDILGASPCGDGYSCVNVIQHKYPSSPPMSIYATYLPTSTKKANTMTQKPQPTPSTTHQHHNRPQDLLHPTPHPTATHTYLWYGMVKHRRGYATTNPIFGPLSLVSGLWSWSRKHAMSIFERRHQHSERSKGGATLSSTSASRGGGGPRSLTIHAH